MLWLYKRVQQQKKENKESGGFCHEYKAHHHCDHGMHRCHLCSDNGNRWPIIFFWAGSGCCLISQSGATSILCRCKSCGGRKCSGGHVGLANCSGSRICL